jgi:hypothetical protein
MSMGPDGAKLQLDFGVGEGDDLGRTEPPDPVLIALCGPPLKQAEDEGFVAGGAAHRSPSSPAATVIR